MTNTIFYLSTCDTCRRILKDINAAQYDFVLQDIKSTPITPEQLDTLREMAGGYEALFSRRSQQYKALGLGEKLLTEKDYRHYILEHYTFLKRPVVIHNGSIYIGNDKKTAEVLKQVLGL